MATQPNAPEVICLGETMALVAPARPVHLRYAPDFRITAAGAESNVACHLASLGVHARWISQLGRDPLGDRILDELLARGVDVASVRIVDDAPTGLYVKNPGRGVHYYRAGSAAARMGPGMVADIDFARVDVIHLTGITPALSASCAELVAAAMTLARQAGTTISFDVNYRPALWPDAAAAGEVIARFANRADLVFVGQDEAEVLWQATDPGQVTSIVGQPDTVVVKDGALGATAVTAGDAVFEPSIPTEVVEPVGAGDAFAAGYLAALLAGRSMSERLRSGHRQASRVLSTTGDLLPLAELIDEGGF